MRFHVVSAILSILPQSGTKNVQLGIGSIGTLVSHHLRYATHSPISLIQRRARNITPKSIEAPTDRPPLSLSVKRNGIISRSTGFDIERVHDASAPEYSPNLLIPDAQNGRIDSLIVCLKTQDTLPALSILSPRIHSSSVITLLQNGMGVYDQLCTSLFPDPATRPHFILGTTTHGVSRTGQHGVISHNSRPGEGEVKYGLVSDPRGEIDVNEWLWPGLNASGAPIISPPRSPVIPLPQPPIPSFSNVHTTLNTLLSMPELSPSLLPIPHLHHQLLLKLAVNSAINALTAILGLGALPNGSLLSGTPARRMLRLVLAETSTVLTAYLHSLSAPESPAADVIRLFSAEALEQATLQVIAATYRNTSSMAADILRGKSTEIDEINGYLVGLGQRLGVPTPTHRMLVEMVKFTFSMSHPGTKENYLKGVKGMRSVIETSGKILETKSMVDYEEKRKADREESLELRRKDLALRDEEMRLKILNNRRAGRKPSESLERYAKWLNRKRFRNKDNGNQKEGREEVEQEEIQVEEMSVVGASTSKNRM